MPPIRFDVESVAGAYAVRIAWGLIGRLRSMLSKVHLGPQRFVVSNPLVWRLHGPAMEEALPGVKPILIPDGERHKRTETVGRIYDALIREKADRSAVILALGGGVVGDTAGFAAATYLRGIAVVQLPTTLLAQVDSAIGGKVGVNHELGKNLIGAFHAPRLVAIDPAMLETLPRREFRAGLYEIVKYGMIASPGLFARLERDLDGLFARKRRSLLPVINESCRIKGRITSADEHDSGERRVLNFGHTIGHALEAITKYRRFRHGEAVAYGMLGAVAIAVARSSCPVSVREALSNLITQMGPLPPVADLSIKATSQAIRRDKKVVRGTLHFVLPAGIGDTAIVDDVSAREIERALKTLGMRP